MNLLQYRSGNNGERSQSVVSVAMTTNFPPQGTQGRTIIFQNSKEAYITLINHCTYPAAVNSPRFSPTLLKTSTCSLQCCSTFTSIPFTTLRSGFNSVSQTALWWLRHVLIRWSRQPDRTEEEVVRSPCSTYIKDLQTVHSELFYTALK